MSQTLQLVSTLKHLLKSRGITYASVASHLNRSVPAIKRQFAQQSFSIKTLESICDLLEIDMLELMQATEAAQASLQQLTEAQETDLVAEPRRLLVAVCVLNHWTLEQIINIYQITKAECIRYLIQLERIGLIQLMPDNRVKLRISRDFAWLPNGPIHRFFREQAQSDFLNASFGNSGEILRFQHAMLTPEARARFQKQLLRLIQDFSELHQESLTSPVDQRYGTSLLLAMRSWEPAGFESLRRTPDKRVYPILE
jgi:transcriptional regulator with XRE-family HTH domain